MTDLIVEIVERVIVHAQSMLEEGAYDSADVARRAGENPR